MAESAYVPASGLGWGVSPTRSLPMEKRSQARCPPCPKTVVALRLGYSRNGRLTELVGVLLGFVSLFHDIALCKKDAVRDLTPDRLVP